MSEPTKKPEWVVVVEATRANGQQKTAKCVEEYVEEPTSDDMEHCNKEMLVLLPPEDGWEKHQLFAQRIRRRTQTW